MPPSPSATTVIHNPVYELRLTQTRDATGYYAPVPSGEPDWEAVAAYLQAHPFDAFMHRYALERLLQWPLDKVRAMAAAATKNRTLMPLLLEAGLIHQPLAPLLGEFPKQAAATYRDDTPLLILRSESLPDQVWHRQWIAILKDNLLHHRPLPTAPEAWPDPLFDHGTDAKTVMLADVAPPPAAESERPAHSPAFEAVYAEAVARLEGLDILVEKEMRHESSLSPIALLRRWRMDVRVEQDRHRFRLRGVQTAYGKGLSLERARASCAMEIAERVSAFATVMSGRLPDSARGHRIRRARLSELRHEGARALDPNALQLEVPYEDQPLYWITGEQVGLEGASPLLIPFQAIYLFANLDEIDLFSGLGSTGLAAGWTLAQAKFHALLECIERDADAVQPFDPGTCFRLTTRDAAVGGLLAAYRQKGIDVVFQDCSGGFGIPCYKSFVYGPDPDTIAKGTSAHFTGWQAALAALTETPYPFPNSPVSRPGPGDLPLRALEDLPDFSSGDVTVDLQRLEALLAANQRHAVYVDLTRRDLDIPVVRALVPGLELMADFDRYARVSERLYRNYRQMASAGTPPHVRG